MPEHDDDSFHKKKMKHKIGTIAGILLVSVVLFAFVIGIYLFGMAGIFELLGVRYTSAWSLFLFVIGFYIIASLLELLIEPISKLLVEGVADTEERAGKRTAWLIRFGMLSLSNGFCLFTVDAFMDSITLTLKTGIFVAMLITFLEMTFDDRGNKPET